MSNSEKLENRIYLIIGHVFFLCFTVACVVYYRERLLNNDAAYYTFHMVNYEEVFVKHQRYISYFTQSLPILLAKAGASLKTVLISYSTIFALWFYLLFIIVAHIFKSPKNAIYLVLSLCLTMRYKHFAGHTEITFAIAVSSFLVAWIMVDKSKLNWYKPTIDWLIKILCISWLYIIHPIIIVPLGIVLAADFFYHKRWKNISYLVFLTLLFSSFGVRFIQVSQDSYESNKMSLLDNTYVVLSNYTDYKVHHIIKMYLEKDYHIIVGITLVCLLGLLWKKKIIPSLILLMGSSILFCLVVVTHSYLRGDVYIMIDGYLGMFGMVWGFIILLFIKEGMGKRIFPYTIAILVLYCSLKIQSKAAFMHNRLQFYQRTFDLYPDQVKLYAGLRFHDWDKQWYPYEIPLESLMLTSLEGKENSKTLYIDYDNIGPKKLINGNDYFLTFDHKMKIDQLNKRFFSLPTDKSYFVVDSVARR